LSDVDIDGGRAGERHLFGVRATAEVGALVLIKGVGQGAGLVLAEQKSPGAVVDFEEDRRIDALVVEQVHEVRRQPVAKVAISCHLGSMPRAEDRHLLGVWHRLRAATTRRGWGGWHLVFDVVDALAARVVVLDRRRDVLPPVVPAVGAVAEEGVPLLLQSQAA